MPMSWKKTPPGAQQPPFFSFLVLATVSREGFNITWRQGGVALAHRFSRCPG
jgi:hypothetical protein